MSSALPTASGLTWVIVPLAAVASGAGLVVGGIYRDPAAIVPAMRGQDLVTLLAIPALLAALGAARQGSPRGTLIWIGLLGYLAYAYIGAAFAYRFNQLFLIYIAVFSLSIAALVAALSGTDVVELAQSFDATTPRRLVAGCLGFIAVVLSGSELSQIMWALRHGGVPDLISRSQGAGNFVYVLDLGAIVPLSLLAAAWLLKGRPWGYMLAGLMLIKASTMGLALLAGTWFSARFGAELEFGLTLGYALIAFGGLGTAVWYFQHCRVQDVAARRL